MFQVTVFTLIVSFGTALYKTTRTRPQITKHDWLVKKKSG